MLPTRFTFAALLALSATGAHAVTVSAAASGLAGADMNVAFDEVVVADGAAVTNQFAAQGVTFSNGIKMSYAWSFPNVDNRALVNFQPIVPSFSVFFNQTIKDATFAMGTNPGPSTFTARLAGVVVESFSATTDINQTNKFYGFTDIAFDEILIVAGGSNAAMVLDNLSYNTLAPVPLPATGLMLLGALGAMAVARRKV